MSIKDQLVLAANLENITRFREFSEEICARWGATSDDCFAIKLAIDEVCSNIIEHGYGLGRQGDISVEIEFVRSEVRVKVIDTGSPFSPDDAARPDVNADWNERPIGRLGWHLIRNLVDDIRYHRDGNENRLTLVKKLERGPDTRQGQER